MYSNNRPIRNFLSLALSILLAGLFCVSTSKAEQDVSAPLGLSSFKNKAESFGSVLSLPPFETTPEAVKKSMEEAIVQANKSLDAIGDLNPEEVTFYNTIVALDHIGAESMRVASRIYLSKETNQSSEMRAVGKEMIKVFDEWAVGLDYREDVYQAVKAFADTNPKLEGEDAKLFEETLRDYRRAGLHLSKKEREEVEELRVKLSSLTTDFQSNISAAKKTLVFNAAELEGVPESFLSQESVKTGDDEYSVMANVTYHFVAVMQNCKIEETRKAMKMARYTLAAETNASLLQEIVELRDTIAKKLGYATWADYKTEPKMAKTGDIALSFVKDLAEGLQPKLEAEIAEFQKLKAADTGDLDVAFELWDWRYYSNLLKKEKYTVDTEELRVYFPYEQTLQGMFDIYEHCFGLTIQEVEPPYKWIDDLTLHLISDSDTEEPLGLVYLDMFPREGKYNHFAQFGLIDGKLLENGKYQRPTVALICNFPTPQGETPSLLSHNEVETLFHEFGHALHSILTDAKYSRFSGTSVPRDFVEAPSQVLERWISDKDVLDRFAFDYRDSSKTIPGDILERMKEARLATIGSFYRRQLSFGLLDLTLHSKVNSENNLDVVELSNEIISDTLLPVPDGTTFVAYFGHLMGYDAGYYGYAWADAIASDMITVFEEAPGGLMNKEVGRRLRDEIFAPGGSRPIDESIERFLGRKRSLEPFLKEIGIE
ncbi:Zn-dependent oligopeptidase [Puniceicoccaceae bacterium K14]|nr:Zn-dependent oligopeptidase [Puniceicoccaceae bacterium K14]